MDIDNELGGRLDNMLKSNDPNDVLLCIEILGNVNFLNEQNRDILSELLFKNPGKLITHWNHNEPEKLNIKIFKENDSES